MSTLNNDHVTSVPQGWVGGWMLYTELIKSEAQTRHFSILTGNTTIPELLFQTQLSLEKTKAITMVSKAWYTLFERVSRWSLPQLYSHQKKTKQTLLYVLVFQVDLLSRTDSWTDEPHQFWVSVGSNKTVFSPLISLEFGYHELVPRRLTYWLKMNKGSGITRLNSLWLHQSTAILWRPTLRSPSHRYLRKL